MSTRIVRAAALLALLAGLAHAAGETIRDIQVRSLDGFGADNSDVLAVIRSKVGDPLTLASQDIKTLETTERFSSVRVVFEKLDDGVRLVYEVVRRHRFVGPVEIVGVDYFSRSKVEDWLDLKDGAPIDDQVLAVKCNKVRDEYLKRYFPQTQVKAAIEPTAPRGMLAHVHVTIVEGPRLKPDAYVFTGNAALSDKELRTTIGDRPWYDPRSWFTRPPYSEQQLADAHQHALDAYLDAGYLDARVSNARFEPLPDNPKRATIAFTVEEGARYAVSGVVVTGVKLFPESQVRAAAGALNVGDVASRKTIQEAAKGIRDFYGSRGYIDTVVSPVAMAETGTVARALVKFEVHESALVTVRNVVIRGNTRTKDKVIRREIPVNPGQIMDEVRIERSEKRLKNLGLFERVSHTTEPNDPAVTNRDLVFDIAEGRTGSFMIGGGFSSVDKVVGYIQLQQGNFDLMNWPNFTGGGQKARLGAELGSNHQTYEASLTEPWFLDRPMAATVDLYLRERKYDEYRITRLGGDVGITYPVAIGSFGIKYTLEQINLDDQLAGTNYWYAVDGRQGPEHYSFMNEPDSALNSQVEFSWDYDTRNQVFVPTRGTQAGVFTDIAGAPLGGDNDIIRMGAQYRHWFGLWWKHVLSLRGRLETVDGYGDGDVPIYDRLFLGGDRTVRGVRYRDIGPKVVTPGLTETHPVGGETLGLASAEYTIPLFEAVRFATFSDIGSVTRDSYQFDKLNDSYSWTYGAGIRIDIPGFPIRFDYAIPIKRDNLTREERFVFWIGFE